MKRSVFEKNIRQKLAAQGVILEPGSRAERGVKLVAQVGADAATAGKRAWRDMRDAVATAAETARESIHAATKPRPKRRKK